MRSSLSLFLVPAAALVAGCSDSSGPPPPVVASCIPADAAGSVVPMAPFEARTFRGSELSRCAWVTGSGAKYLVVPQFATENAARTPIRYALGSGGSLATMARLAGTETLSPAVQLDNVLRQIERRLPRETAREAELRALAAASQALRGPSLQQVGTTRTFQVLSK